MQRAGRARWACWPWDSAPPPGAPLLCLLCRVCCHRRGGQRLGKAHQTAAAPILHNRLHAEPPDACSGRRTEGPVESYPCHRNLLSHLTPLLLARAVASPSHAHPLHCTECPYHPSYNHFALPLPLNTPDSRQQHAHDLGGVAHPYWNRRTPPPTRTHTHTKKNIRALPPLTPAACP